jgi:cell wall assembly regulator SMI1
MPKMHAPAMPALLERLETWLRRHRPEYFAWLRPGVPERELMAFERELGRNLPSGLRALYRWHDGQDPKCALAFQHDKLFMPLEDLRSAKAALDYLQAGGEFPEPNWWSGAWLPFLDNGHGDHLCADLDGAFAGKPGQVVSFYHDLECRSIEFPSLERWLEAFVIGIDAGLWEEDGPRFHPLDAERERVLRVRLTPHYPLERAAGGFSRVMHGW